MQLTSAVESRCSAVKAAQPSTEGNMKFDQRHLRRHSHTRYQALLGLALSEKGADALKSTKENKARENAGWSREPGKLSVAYQTQSCRKQGRGTRGGTICGCLITAMTFLRRGSVVKALQCRAYEELTGSPSVATERC